MKKLLTLALALSVALAGVPAQAEVFGPNTIWGTVPAGASAAANAVLFDTVGNRVMMVPIVEGRFAFRDLPPGQYVVALQTGAGQELARSLTVALGSGLEAEAVFATNPTPAAVPPPAPAAGGGISTTAWILIGAAAAGITTAIVLATDDDEKSASPIR